MLFAAALHLFALVSHVLAVLVNRTIDDQFGDPITGIMPVYSPEANWQQGATCGGCWAQPSKYMTFDGTWHDSTYFVTSGGPPHSITIPFNGSAIYIFFVTVLQKPSSPADGETHLNITLDGQQAGVFDFVPGPSDSYRYNVSVYANSNIRSGIHTIVISTEVPSVMEFDYAVYSIEDGTQPSTSSQRKAPIGAIVGGVVSGLAVISAVILFLFFYRRHNSDSNTPHTFVASMPDQRAYSSDGHNEGHGVFTYAIDSAIPTAPGSDPNQKPRLLTYGYTSPVSTSCLPGATTPSIGPIGKTADLQVRQIEQRDQMQDMQPEMAREPPSTSQIRSIENASGLRNVMSAEVELLRQAQGSLKVQGFSNEPVPPYTTFETH